jgi:hypothetical protein
MLRQLTALLLGLVAVPAAGQEDLEALYRTSLAACKDDGAAAVRSARIRAELSRPRLLPVLPQLDVNRYCECKFESRRSAFGLERAVRFDSPAGDEGLSPQDFVALQAQDDSLMLDCIELAATGTRQFSDPAEAQLADLVDYCQNKEIMLNALAARFLKEMSPEEAKQRIAGLDRPALCRCFYEGQRAEFGLADAVGFNSISGPGRQVSAEEGKRVMARKAAIFQDCAAGRAPAAGAGGEAGAEGVVAGEGGRPARTGTWGRASVLGLVGLLLAAGITGTVLYRRRREQERLRQRRQSPRSRPSARR